MADQGRTSESKPGLLERMRARRRAWVFRKGKQTRKRLMSFFARQSLVGDHEVFDKTQFDWAMKLEANADKIRAELDTVLEHRDALPRFQDISKDNARIATETKWRAFMFYGFGDRSERSAALCPETARILDSIPDIKSAWFSILAPRYHVPTHRGISKGIIRCHLALKVPKADGCRMRVGKTRFHWEEGKAVVFDDLFRHEVWNDTDEERVVLLVDVVRPMRWRGRLMGRAFLWAARRTAYYKDARKNQLEWENRFHASLERQRQVTSPRAATPAGTPELTDSRHDAAAG